MLVSTGPSIRVGLRGREPLASAVVEGDVDTMRITEVDGRFNSVRPIDRRAVETDERIGVLV